jgi:transcriptional regulator with XRE-family HTH domain
MTPPALSRLEAGGVIPTIPLLDRICASLDADLTVEIAPHATQHSAQLPNSVHSADAQPFRPVSISANIPR